MKNASITVSFLKKRKYLKQKNANRHSVWDILPYKLHHKNSLLRMFRKFSPQEGAVGDVKTEQPRRLANGGAPDTNGETPNQKVPVCREWQSQVRLGNWLICCLGFYHFYKVVHKVRIILVVCLNNIPD